MNSKILNNLEPQQILLFACEIARKTIDHNLIKMVNLRRQQNEIIRDRNYTRP